MNEKAREIIEVAKELTETGKRASDVGIVGVSPREFQIYEAETFKEIVKASNIAPGLEIINRPDYPYTYDYPYAYRVSLGGFRFLHLSEAPIYPADEVEVD